MNETAAVFTFANNDGFFLPRWYRFYRQFFTDRDIYVFDHNSNDGSMDELRTLGDCNIERVEHPYFGDFEWYTAKVQEVQRRLLKRYDVVVFAEPDEIVWASGGLDRFITRFEGDYATCTGYDVIQTREEARLSDEQPIFAQRRYWYAEARYDKTLVSRIPLEWAHGFHRTTNVDPRPDPDLLLIHLHRVDYEMARARHKMRSRQEWRPDASEKGWAWHLRTTRWRFKRWFYTPLTKPTSRQGPLEEIPFEVRQELQVV